MDAGLGKDVVSNSEGMNEVCEEKVCKDKEQTEALSLKKEHNPYLTWKIGPIFAEAARKPRGSPAEAGITLSEPSPTRPSTLDLIVCIFCIFWLVVW